MKTLQMFTVLGLGLVVALSGAGGTERYVSASGTWKIPGAAGAADMDDATVRELAADRLSRGRDIDFTIVRLRAAYLADQLTK